MKKKQIISIMIIACMLAGILAACGGSSSSTSPGTAATPSTSGAAAPSAGASSKADDTVYTMRLAYSYPESSQHAKNMAYFKEVTERETNGRIEVVIYPGAQLAAEDKQLALLQSGGVDAVYSINGSMETICPEEAIYTLPFFWTTEPGKSEEFYKAAFWDSPIESWLRDNQKEQGFYRLGHITTQIGQFTLANNVREVKFPEDMAGLKVRHSGGMVATMTLEKLGANPITIAGSEVPVALSQGVMDGLQTSVKHQNDNLWYTKYLNATHIKCYSIPLILNLAWYESLPQDLQDILQTVVMPDVYEWAYNETSKGELKGLEEMAAPPHNTVIVINTPEEIEERWANFNNLREEGLKLYLQTTGENGRYLLEEALKIKESLGNPVPEIPEV